MKILAIVGSLRTESYNRQLADAAQHMLAESNPDVSFEILDWAEVPLFNQDIEFPTPPAVAQVRDAVKGADGIWFFTPEYNHSYPGVLKNLIDWLSRPVSETEGHVLAGKPAAFCGTSIGMSGSTHAQEFLIPLLSFVNMQIMNSPRLVLPHIGNQINEKGQLVLDSSAPYLKRQAEAFLTFIKK